MKSEDFIRGLMTLAEFPSARIISLWTYMHIKKKYIQQAEKLLSAQFRMFGYGHFDLTFNEVALILQLLSDGEYEKLHDLYEELSEQRLP